VRGHPNSNSSGFLIVLFVMFGVRIGPAQALEIQLTQIQQDS
jgi:hypothetical protein